LSECPNNFAFSTVTMLLLRSPPELKRQPVLTVHQHYTSAIMPIVDKKGSYRILSYSTI